MDKDIYDRMERFIRKAANRAASCDEADEILKLIEPPVDPDLLAAREICIDVPYPHSEAFYRSGKGDTSVTMQRVVAGIKFGRAHALSDLAKLPDDESRARELIKQISGENEYDAIDAVVDGIAYGRAQLEPQRTVPPIKQDLIDAREIVATNFYEGARHLHGLDAPQAIRRGEWDNYPIIQQLVSAFTSRREP